MSTENVSTFLTKVQSDRALAEKLVFATAEAMAKLAEQEGLAFSAEDLLRFQAESMSDAELEAVAGGGRQSRGGDKDLSSEEIGRRFVNFLGGIGGFLEETTVAGRVSRAIRE